MRNPFFKDKTKHKAYLKALHSIRSTIEEVLKEGSPKKEAG